MTCTNARRPPRRTAGRRLSPAAVAVVGVGQEGFGVNSGQTRLPRLAGQQVPVGWRSKSTPVCLRPLSSNSRLAPWGTLVCPRRWCVAGPLLQKLLLLLLGWVSCDCPPPPGRGKLRTQGGYRLTMQHAVSVRGGLFPTRGGRHLQPWTAPMRFALSKPKRTFSCRRTRHAPRSLILASQSE